MITDTLAEAGRYAGLSPRFAAAFDFLKALPADQPDGRYELADDNGFALVQRYPGKPIAEARFEAHRRYIDIQFIQAGREQLLWAPLATLTQVTEAYAAERDIAFFAHPPQWTALQLQAGQFAIFFPEDGHAPGIASNDFTGEIRKVVIKVQV